MSHRGGLGIPSAFCIQPSPQCGFPRLERSLTAVRCWKLDVGCSATTPARPAAALHCRGRVAGCPPPPHRSRRAGFPHRDLQPDTLSLAHRKVCQFGSVDLTELVACVDFVRWSAPSAISGLLPCSDLLRADPTPRTASAASPCR